MTSRDVTIRPAHADDAPQIAHLAIAGFETYRAFAPDGWEPPTIDAATAEVIAALALPSAWCTIASDAAGHAGHVGWLAAEHARRPVADPGLAHLWQLFVRRDRWGDGLARRLHDAALEAAGARGFTVMRLYTPARQARARRFYEREGWTLARPAFDDAAFGMSIVEYRRALAASATSG